MALESKLAMVSAMVLESRSAKVWGMASGMASGTQSGT